MAEVKSFYPVKLICGLIASREEVFKRAEERLYHLYREIDLQSQLFQFNFTDYYEKQMGRGLKRKFLSFVELIKPERLSEIKLETNRLEEEIRKEFKARRRIVNLDPGYLTSSALIMATAKNFAHRIPLQQGIYAHLELLFTRKEVKILDWTYPDFKMRGYQQFFLKAREVYLDQMRAKVFPK